MMSPMEYYTEPLSIMSFILEDDEDDAKMIQEVFEDGKFGEYLRFERGSEVVKALLNRRVHIFISDYRGIDLDGIEVMRKVKQDNDRCIFILVSEFVTNEIVKRAVNEIHIQYYVDKRGTITEEGKVQWVEELKECVMEAEEMIKNDIEFIRKIKGKIERLNPVEAK